MSASPTHDSDSKLGEEPRPVLSTQTADSAARRYVVPDGVNEKKLMRKVDFRIIPWLSVLYLISFLDRSAIGNARLYGLEEDLGILNTNKFNIASSIFFFPYALFEIPSNIMLKRLRPSVWFPLITCLVGICMMSQGLVSSYGGLLVARFFLGVTEAGLFPGANYLLSGWYKRSEFGLRASIFFSAATVSGAFGGECGQPASPVHALSLLLHPQASSQPPFPTWKALGAFSTPTCALGPRTDAPPAFPSPPFPQWLQGALGLPWMLLACAC